MKKTCCLSLILEAFNRCITKKSLTRSSFSAAATGIAAVVLMLAFTPSVFAILYLNEPFNYTAGALGTATPNGTWDTTTKSAINVVASSLTVPAGYPAASGNKITLGNTGHNQQNFNTFTSSGTIVGGTVYASFLLNVSSTGSMPSSDSTTSPNYNDAFTLALQNAASAGSPFCSVRFINSSGCKIGIAKNGGTGSYRGTALTTGTTVYQVVVKYDFTTSPNTVKLYASTTYMSTEPGSADATISTGTDLAPGSAGLGKCYVSDAAGGTFSIDELRIGSTWADAVGGAAGTSTTTTVGQTAGTTSDAYGTTETFTATISPSPGANGTVTFTDGATTLASGVAVSGGVATYTTTTALAYNSGTAHVIKASYTGAGGFNNSADAVGVSHTVAQKALTITANTGRKTYGSTYTVVGTGQSLLSSSGLVSGETISSVTITASGGTTALSAAGGSTLSRPARR